MMIKMAKLSMTWRAVILESRAFDSEISFHDRAIIVEQGIWFAIGIGKWDQLFFF